MTSVPYDVSGSSGNRVWADRAAVPDPIPPFGPLGDEHRAYLRSRGLRRPAVERYQLASLGKAIVFPVMDGGYVVNAIVHRPWYRVRYESVRGREACLYPLARPPANVVLVAGMFDALVARQHGVPAITTTCGSVLPATLAERFAGRRVAVVFDSGEEKQAARALNTLATVGAEAWTVPLPLADGGDVADWFVKHGRSRRDLYRLIRRARRAT